MATKKTSMSKAARSQIAEWSNDGKGNKSDSFVERFLGDFYGNQILKYLYYCNDPLPDDFDAARSHLRGIADASRSDLDRAADALALAKFASSVGLRGIRDFISVEFELVELAIDLGSMVAVVEKHAMWLKDHGLRFPEKRERQVLPTYVPIDPYKPVSTEKIEDPEFWQRAVDRLLDAGCEGFPDWSLDELRAGFVCLTHYLSMPVMHGKDRACRQDHARQQLLWAKPLMQILIEKIARLSFEYSDDDSEVRFARRRAHAIELVLNDLAQGKHPIVESEVNDDSTKQSASEHPIVENEVNDDSTKQSASEIVEVVADVTESLASADTVIVIKGVIPPDADRDTRPLLRQYEALRKPMPLAAMPDRKRIEEIQSVLELEFPWAQDAITAIVTEIRARKRFGSRVLGMPPVLLCGTPGTGKTRLAQRFSELLEIPNTVINMAGMTDTKTLKGVTRGWASNRPSRIVESVLRTGPSHLFVLDEVDKAHGYAGGNGGDPQEALLDLLEPLNASRYGDVFLQTECDVSHCLYILTANSLKRIAEPLLSRMTLAYVPMPGPEHAQVLMSGVLRDLEKEWRIPVGALQLDPRQSDRLIGLAPREMKRAVKQMLGDSASDARYILH